LSFCGRVVAAVVLSLGVGCGVVAAGVLKVVAAVVLSFYDRVVAGSWYPPFDITAWLREKMNGMVKHAFRGQ
jgi:hypothetical protein